MTTTTTTTTTSTLPIAPPPATSIPRRLTVTAGAVYVGAWLTGLATGPTAPDPFAAAAEVHRFFLAYGSAAALQSLLVHGVAAAGLSVVVIVLGRTLSSPFAGWSRFFGLSAVAVSLLQFGLMAVLVAGVAPGTAGTTTDMFHAINYADSAKLLLLSGLVATVTVASRRIGRRRWLGWLGMALTPLLPISGAAFLVESNFLFGALYLSLPLLLAWVAATAIAVARRR